MRGWPVFTSVMSRCSTVGSCDLWVPNCWLLDAAFECVDTWIPVTDLFGAYAGVMHVQFVGDGWTAVPPAPLRAFTLTVENAALAAKAEDLLGPVSRAELCWSDSWLCVLRWRPLTHAGLCWRCRTSPPLCYTLA